MQSDALFHGAPKSTSPHIHLNSQAPQDQKKKRNDKHLVQVEMQALWFENAYLIKYDICKPRILASLLTTLLPPILKVTTVSSSHEHFSTPKVSFCHPIFSEKFNRVNRLTPDDIYNDINPFYLILSSAKPEELRFSKKKTCHLLWSQYLTKVEFFDNKVDYGLYATKTFTIPRQHTHLKSFPVHRPFTIIDALKYDDMAIKNLRMRDLGLDLESFKDLYFCINEIFLFMFFNQFKLTPKFLDVRWQPHNGSFILETESFEDDLTELPYEIMSNTSKMTICYNLAQEIMYLLRTFSLLGWFCFDFKPQNIVYKQAPTLTGEQYLKLRMVDFDARYYGTNLYPFPVIFWCNLFALVLNFESIHCWKNLINGEFWWWHQGLATFLVNILHLDVDLGLPQCIRIWTYLAKNEPKDEEGFVDPFYVSWFYREKRKHPFIREKELEVEIAKFIRKGWQNLYHKYYKS